MGFSGVRLVVVEGEPERVSCGGLADHDRSLPWTLETRSQAASLSKQFAAACALILAGTRVLSLDDSVRAFLPEAGEGWDEVTIGQLLTQTSGMPHWTDSPGLDASSAEPAAQRLRLLLDAPRRSTGVFAYSSPGYVILSAVLAAVADEPYAQLVERLILAPLSLTGTSVGVPAPGASVARGYRGATPVDAWDPGRMPGTGDIWTTAPDLARFVKAFHSGGLLPDAAAAMLPRLRVPLPPAAGAIAAHSYGAGHFVGVVRGEPAFLHPGDNPGFQALVIWFPRTATTVVVLSNDEAADIAAAALDA